MGCMARVVCFMLQLDPMFLHGVRFTKLRASPCKNMINPPPSSIMGTWHGVRCTPQAVLFVFAPAFVRVRPARKLRFLVDHGAHDLISGPPFHRLPAARGAARCSCVQVGAGALARPRAISHRYSRASRSISSSSAEASVKRSVLESTALITLRCCCMQPSKCRNRPSYGAHEATPAHLIAGQENVNG